MYACSGQCASTCSISPLTNSLSAFRIIKSLFSFISFGKDFLSKKRFFIILSGESFLMSKRTRWPLDSKNKDFRPVPGPAEEVDVPASNDSLHPRFLFRVVRLLAQSSVRAFVSSMPNLTTSE